MQSLIPQPKQIAATEGDALRLKGEERLSLFMEQDEPRLVIHCRRAFPGMEYTCSRIDRGYLLVIERLPGKQMQQIVDEVHAAQEAHEAQEAQEAPKPQEVQTVHEAPEAMGVQQKGLVIADVSLFIGNDETHSARLAGRAQGYRLEVSSRRAEVYALDAAGLFYGLQTLVQLRGSDGDIPALSITDWPDTAVRAMNLDLRQTFSKPELLIGYLAEFARYKTNAILVEYEDKFPFRTHPEFAHPKHALSLSQLEELKRTAHEHFIEIIPLQQSFGHLEYVLRHEGWRHLRETEQSTGEICPSHPETYGLITTLLEEMIDAHPDSRYIHLGCDEVYSLCECERCKVEFGGIRERAFIAFLNRLIAFTAERGKQPIFWHDMLDKCPPDELAKLDQRSAAMIWIYNGRNIEAEVTSHANKFRSLGIEIMGAPAVRSFDWAEHQNYPVLLNRTDNLLQWAETADKLDLDCVVATNWTGPFSLGVPYGIFETTWYPMLLHADLAWNRKADAASFIDRFLERFHGIDPVTGHNRLGNYRVEDYYDVIWKLMDEVREHKEEAELIAIMHDFEVATDRSRAIHKYAYRWELYPGDDAEWRSLHNNYTRNRRGRDGVLPRMKAALERYQSSDMAEHFVKSRFYLHDYLERTLYHELGLNVIHPAANRTVMSLEDKIAMMCVVGTPSTRAEPEFRGRMSQHPFGGIGIFPHNIESEPQTLALLAEVQRIAEDSGSPLPYYISVDEEGGTLSKFKSFFPYIPGNRAVGLSEDPEAARLLGRVIGSELHSLGIPMNWAPVLDVNTNIDNPVVGVRSFGEDPQLVAGFGRAYIQGMHEAGVAVTAKHFPGHGQVSGDSHIVLPECELTLEQLMEGPLLPFVEAIEAGADSIMMGHLVFPNIPESGGLPASLSPYFASKLLRGKLGFAGVICTDDIEMGAIRKHFSPEEVGVLAVQAGNDMILMCHTPEFQNRVIASILGAVRDGRISEARIDESVLRIRQLYDQFLQYRAAAQPIPREQWEKTALKLARMTVKVSRDPQGLLPLKDSLKYLLILPQQEQLTQADNSGSAEIRLESLLKDEGLIVEVRYCAMKPDAEQIVSMVQKAADADVVIQGTLNAHLFTGQLALAEALAAVKPLLNLVLRNPYDDGALPQSAGSILLCSTSDFSLRALVEYMTASK
ncbi:family 20 glycosylhydrolase [Paenibacillus sp. JNUCC31]|uniref:glycoside hydrolase family 3 N-terminal domain-containing protein n=1 Tax=Paenibacillus sp. JNUCC-31 TaxID=2777983 RepID=UPI00177D66DA|nr:glycoside hydrolase family 3 N-terminal domain-containing protein [Paenibacillus sp. JNUCC-31]QOS80451.1 family 20 glycosylhydrolase [Paenibacillus sp. JNUCC-31]